MDFFDLRAIDDEMRIGNPEAITPREKVIFDCWTLNFYFLLEDLKSKQLFITLKTDELNEFLRLSEFNDKLSLAFNACNNIFEPQLNPTNRSRFFDAGKAIGIAETDWAYIYMSLQLFSILRSTELLRLGLLLITDKKNPVWVIETVIANLVKKNVRFSKELQKEINFDLRNAIGHAKYRMERDSDNQPILIYLKGDRKARRLDLPQLMITAKKHNMLAIALIRALAYAARLGHILV